MHQFRRFLTKNLSSNREAGGAAIEYVIVSTFATFLAIAAIATVGKVIKDKLKGVEEKLGISVDLGLDNLK